LVTVQNGKVLACLPMQHGRYNRAPARHGSP
jgi:hypothetical protein